MASARGLRVEALGDEEFADWFDGAWKPGEHVSIVTPTGGGKTTLAVFLLQLRRYVIVVAPKGVDDTLRRLHATRLATWPGERKMDRLLAEDEKAGRPSRYVIGPEIEGREDWPKLKTAAEATLDGAYRMGGWTLYIDELQVATDQAMMNLSGLVSQWLVSARSRSLSFVSSFQAPRRVPTAALHEPTWVLVSRTRDADVVNRTAEVLGRPKAEIRGYLAALPRYHWLCVGRDPDAPVVVTVPPKA